MDSSLIPVGQDQKPGLTKTKVTAYFVNCEKVIEKLKVVQDLENIQDSANKLEEIYFKAPDLATAKLYTKLGPNALKLVDSSKHFFPANLNILQRMSLHSLPECYRLCSEFCENGGALADSMWESCCQGSITFPYHTYLDIMMGSLQKARQALGFEGAIIREMENSLRVATASVETLEKMPDNSMITINGRMASFLLFESKNKDSLRSFKPEKLRRAFHEYLTLLNEAGEHLTGMATWFGQTSISLQEAGGRYSSATETVSNNFSMIPLKMQTRLKDMQREWKKAKDHFTVLGSEHKSILSTSRGTPNIRMLLEGHGRTLEHDRNESTSYDAPSDSALELLMPDDFLVNCISYLMEALRSLPYIDDYVEPLARFWEYYRAHREARFRVRQVIEEDDERGGKSP